MGSNFERDQIEYPTLSQSRADANSCWQSKHGLMSQLISVAWQINFQRSNTNNHILPRFSCHSLLLHLLHSHTIPCLVSTGVAIPIVPYQTTFENANDTIQSSTSIYSKSLTTKIHISSDLTNFIATPVKNHEIFRTGTSCMSKNTHFNPSTNACQNANATA